MKMRIDVDSRGPIFDGRAKLAAHDFAGDLSEKVAEDGRRKVADNLHRSIRHPTGYYESHVRVEPRGSLQHVVTDGGVVYGPWLEGVGSRNSSTRFKGYASFRRAVQETESSADGTAKQMLPRYIARME
jgi:hypothetical protein